MRLGLGGFPGAARHLLMINIVLTVNNYIFFRINIKHGLEMPFDLFRNPREAQVRTWVFLCSSRQLETRET
jgi:hypothetical protein